MLAAMTLLTGAAYPAAITLIAHVLWPVRSEGSFIVAGTRGGSASHRSGAFGSAVFLGPALRDRARVQRSGLGGSNLGATNPALAEAVLERTARLKETDPPANDPVPVDLVTASGSGLDPDLSPAAAMVQVPRVARCRGLDESAVRALVARHVQGRQWGILGEPRVNVLLLNLDLDAPGTRH